MHISEMLQKLNGLIVQSSYYGIVSVKCPYYNKYKLTIFHWKYTKESK